MTLSIIIPVYNEEKTIVKILELVEKVDLGEIKKEFIIIDDCSTDKTREILGRYKDKYVVILKDRNEGKGVAVKTGLLKATGQMAIIQDADLEYDPQDYKELIKPILDGRADVVYGSRFIGDKPHRALYFWHLCGNKFLTFLSNLLTNLTLTDMETCYKLLSRQAIDEIKEKLTAKRFGIEPEITALIAKKKFRIYEVGISYYGRTYQEGKKINWRDGLAAVYFVVKYNLFR